jgi:hypothetical protein
MKVYKNKKLHQNDTNDIAKLLKNKNMTSNIKVKNVFTGLHPVCHITKRCDIISF